MRYVGKTCESLSKRLNKHVYAAKNDLGKCYRICWIKSVLNSGHRPIIQEIVSVEDNWQWWEAFFIKWFREIEPKMTNLTDGGDGPSINDATTEVSCDVCGRVVTRYRNYVANNTHNYCSRPCASAGRTMFKVGVRSGPRAARVHRTCMGCGGSFTVKESSLRNRPCLYCSKPCAFKYGNIGRARKHVRP